MAIDARVIETVQTEWHAWRRAGLGGSDAAAICGFDPFRSAMNVWLEKVGYLRREEEDEAQRWGKLLEPAIADEFETRTGLFVVGRQDRVTHPSLPFLRATVDGYVDERPDAPDDDEHWPNPLGVYEAKTASRRTSDWSEGVPEHVQIQLQHNLAVAGFDRGWVAALLLWPVPHLTVHEVTRDDAAIAVLQDIETAFWERVVERRPPPADGSETTASMIRQAFADSEKDLTVELSETAVDLIREREQARVEEKRYADRRQAAENALMSLLGPAEIGQRAGRQLVTWKRFSQQRLDVDALKARMPRVATRFMKVVPGRRLLIKPLQEESDGE